LVEEAGVPAEFYYTVTKGYTIIYANLKKKKNEIEYFFKISRNIIKSNGNCVVCLFYTINN
jgi:hypothetical protein